MAVLNKFLVILLMPLILIIGLFAADSYAPKSMRPAKLFGAIDVYRKRLQNPLGTSAPESGTTNEKEALAQLTDILKKNQDKTAANGAIDRSLETIFEDDGSYGVNDPRLKILEARREADRIQAEAERKAQAELRAALNANGTNAANTDGTVAPINSSKVIVFDGSAGVMPDAEDKINSLNVPESVRQEILNTYRRTGILPDFIAGEGDVSGRNPANNH